LKKNHKKPRKIDKNTNLLLNFSDIKKSLSFNEIESKGNVFKSPLYVGDFKN